MDSLKFSNSELSTGKNPQNTTGFAGSYPASGSLQGLPSSVIVSPTRVSRTCFIEAVKTPISPADKLSTF